MPKRRRPSPTITPNSTGTTLTSSSKNHPSDALSKRETESLQDLKLPLLLSDGTKEGIPEWLPKDIYILNGYRYPGASFKACFALLWHLHNETVNIWSHLGMGIGLGCLLWWSFGLVSSSGEGTEVVGETRGFVDSDLWMLKYYLIGAIGSMLFSATFHCLFCHSQYIGNICLKLDYLGIALNITSTGISAIYFIFCNTPDRLRTIELYMRIIGFCGVGAFWTVLDPAFQGVNAAGWRLMIFGTPYVSCYIAIIHAYLAEDVDTSRYPFSLLVGESCMHVVGALVYVLRIPERWYPGSFDIWGASHQVFHFLVAAGQVMHVLAMRTVLLQRYMS